MAIKLKKQAAGSVARPAASHVAFFIDQDGMPSLKDSTGAVQPSVTADGSPLSLLDQGGQPASEATKVKLFAQNTGGITEFFVLDDQNNSIQITQNGGVRSLPAINVLWQGGTPGNTFVNGDTANPTYRDMVMTSVSAGESITVQLPVMAASNAGQTLGVNFTQKANVGSVLFVPQLTDTVLGGAAGAPFPTNDAGPGHSYTLFADGNGGWWWAALGFPA